MNRISKRAKPDRIPQRPGSPGKLEPCQEAEAKLAPEAVVKPAPLKQKVVVRNLDFYYGASRALDSVSLPIYANTVTAFIGPSGCGKSTRRRVLNRMYDLYPNQKASGEVLLDGENILCREQDLNLLRARVRHGVSKAHTLSDVDPRQHRFRRQAL